MRDSDLFYKVYDDLFADKDYAGEVRRVLDLGLGEGREGGNILEIGAGTGNHSIACARLGYEVTAVEPDAAMMEIMRTKLDKAEPELAARIHCFHGAVESIDKGEFDMAFAMFNVINYLPSLDLLRSFMEGVARLLPSGRSFIFDVWNGVAVLLDPPKDKETRVDTDTHSVRTRLTSETDFMKMETKLTYHIERRAKTDPEPERGTYQMSHSLWTPGIIENAAERADLDVVKICPLDDLSRSATENDWKILFHCRKD